MRTDRWDRRRCCTTLLTRRRCGGTGDRSSGLSRTRQPPDGKGHSYCPTTSAARADPDQKESSYPSWIGSASIWDRPKAQRWETGTRGGITTFPTSTPPGMWAPPESDGLFRYDPDRHGAPTSPYTVDGGWLAYLPATVADGASRADVQDALKPYRPEGFPDDPDAYQQMWRHDVGGGSWHKEMGQLVLLVPADELVAWLEADGYDPQQMFARGWPNPDEERLIRNTWGRNWDRDNPADWRNRLADGVGWLEQGVEIGDSGNLAADIEAAIHISAWMDWAYRARLDGGRFPRDQVLGGGNRPCWRRD